MKYYISKNDSEEFKILEFSVFLVSKGIYMLKVAFNVQTEFESDLSGDNPGWTELVFSDKYPIAMDDPVTVAVQFHHDQPGILHGGMETDTYWGIFYEMSEYMDRIEKRRVPLNNLLSEEVEILRDLKEGADISGYADAQIIREIEAKHPELISVSGPRGQYKVKEKLPYLGAILTSVGIQVLQDLGIEFKETANVDSKSS